MWGYFLAFLAGIIYKWWDTDETAGDGQSPPSTCHYTIYVTGGQIVSVEGSLKASAISECGDVLSDSGASGWFACVTQDGRRRLIFSADFPEHPKQRLRNILMNS